MSRSIGEDLAELVNVEGQTNEVETTEESQPETVEETSEETTEEAPAPSQEEQPEEETTPESSAEKKEVPFHKHPRWQRLQKELQEAREEARLAREEAKRPQTVTEEKRLMPEAFTKLFGSNEEAWGEWQKLGLMTEEQVEQKIQAKFEEQQAQSRMAEEAQSKAVQWAEDEFLNLADETGIDFTDSSNTERNQILDICDKYQLFTADGLPNIQVANELRMQLYPEPENEIVQEKKRVVTRTNVKTNAGAKESNILTPSKLRELEKRGGVDQFFK